MIDDATLTEWEQNHKHIDSWGYELRAEFSSRCSMCALIAEIRRLREELAEGWDE